MPKKNVTTQVYVIENPAGRVRVRVGPGADGMVIEIMQEGAAEAFILNFAAWQALCDTLMEWTLTNLCAALRERDERIAALEAELAKARELLRQERELLWYEVIAYGTGRNDQPVRCIIINDTFAYATADAEQVSDDDLPVVYDAWKRWGHHGVTAWVAIRRNAEPLEPLRTEQYRQARAALAEVKR